MIIVLPVGHDKEIYRFPFVTVAIMAICVSVQVYSCATQPSDEELRAHQRELSALYQKVWSTHGREWARRKHPEVLKRPESVAQLMKMRAKFEQVRKEFVEEFEQGRIVPKDHPDYRQLEQLQEKLVQGMGVYAHGYRPGAKIYTLVLHMFIHGGWIHLIGNMIFLYLCGCNMEDRWGPAIWVAFYVVGGVAAGLAWSLLNPDSKIPLVGASGAIAAAMGAFLIVNHKASIQFFYLFWVIAYPIKGTFYLRAYWALPLWLLQQVLGMWSEGQHLTPVAYSAHVGGFALGVVVALVMKSLGADKKLEGAAQQQAVVYTEHPLLMDALQQRDQGNIPGAVASLEQLLREKPDHLDAALELYRLQEDPSLAVEAAGKAIILAKRGGDMDTPLAVYADMNQRHPGAMWNDRALLSVAETYDRRGDPSSAVSVYERLVRTDPDSPLAPKALINWARICKEQLNRFDQAREILEHVVNNYHDSAFADVAERMLRELSVSDL